MYVCTHVCHVYSNSNVNMYVHITGTCTHTPVVGEVYTSLGTPLNMYTRLHIIKHTTGVRVYMYDRTGTAEVHACTWPL